MATILKARLDDKATAEQVLSLPEGHPMYLAATIALRVSPELIYPVQEYICTRADFSQKILRQNWLSSLPSAPFY